MKRKTLLAPNVEGHAGHGGPLATQTTPAHGHGMGHGMGIGHAGPVPLPMPGTAEGQGLGLNARRPLGFGSGKVSAVVGGMEANGASTILVWSLYIHPCPADPANAARPWQKPNWS